MNGDTATAARARARVARAPRHASARRRWIAALIALGALAAAMVVGIAVGAAGFGPWDVVTEFASHVPGLGVSSTLTQTEATILWEIRLPRVVLAALVGAMLATAGGAYQGVFRNPLADPYLLGVAAGAGLGATLAIVYGQGGSLTPLFAFLGGAVAAAAAFALGFSSRRSDAVTMLILAGVTVASFFTALQTFVAQQNTEVVVEIYSWILGRLLTSGWGDVLMVLPYIVVSIGLIVVHRRLLDVMAVGDDEVASLGVNVARVRLVVVIAATLGTAAAVAASGLIGFVGIIVPHAVRMAVGGGYRVILPLSVLVGGAFLVFADVLARTLLAPAEIPIGVVTAFFGAPFFAYVLRTARAGR